MGFGLGLGFVAIVHHSLPFYVGVDLPKQCPFSSEIRSLFCAVPQSGFLCSFFLLSCLCSSNILLSLKVGSLVVKDMREYVSYYSD